MNITKLGVKLTLTEDMLGTVPKDPAVYASYIATKAPEAMRVAALSEEVATVEKIEEKGWTGFHKDESGLFVYDYMIRGFLKNAGNVLKVDVGVKNLKSKIDNYVFVLPRRVHFVRDGAHLDKADGMVERPLRAMTMQGPRVTLARSDKVLAGTVLEFTVSILKNAEIDAKLIKSLFEYGTLCGLGQFKNGSYGRFDAEYPA